MKKIIYKSLIFIFVIFFTVITYFSLFGFETNKFNNKITNQIKKVDQNLDVELKTIILFLDPFNLSISAKTLGPKIKYKKKSVEIETIETQFTLKSLINRNFILKNLEISTKSLEIKNLISFIRSFQRNAQLLFLERFVKKGFLIADIKINFDDNGKIKNNYSIKGFVKDGKIDFFKKYSFEKINFLFNLEKDESTFNDVKVKYDNFDLNFTKIFVKNKSNKFLVNGEIKNKDLIFDKEYINNFFQIQKFEIDDVNLNLDSKFSFDINKKFQFNNFKFKSSVELNDANVISKFDLNNIFPDVKDKINFNDHKLFLDYQDKNFSLKGNGNILFQNNNDKISYSIKKIDEKFEFQSKIEIVKNIFKIETLNYIKEKDTKLEISIKGSKILDKNTLIDSISIKENNNSFLLENIHFNKDFNLIRFEKAELEYFDNEDNKNQFEIISKKNDYLIEGKFFNANILIEKLIKNDDKKKFNFPKKKSQIKIKLNQVRLDTENEIENLTGYLTFDNNKISEADLSSSFSEKEILKFTVSTEGDEQITTFFSDRAKPFIKRYEFIKGFENGQLDFYSRSKNNLSNSILKIYDFKLREVPTLTKLLTLASLQGIADLLSGEGIRFDEFEMNFDNKDELMTINEIYGIGPSISILMEGYIQKNKLVSLRGTLVPATTINKVIASIPLLGEILVGSKTGEGVFGVSFKIKGPPKKLQTTVNPIKTLTPRFITRTLEKIKKN
tara:strand:+ start:1065 stop:3251 length:2187 start_codon:yes stop_codon:yes gene_type:complete